MSHLRLSAGSTVKGLDIGDRSIDAVEASVIGGVSLDGVVAWVVGGSGPSNLRDLRYRAKAGDRCSFVYMGDASALEVIRHSAAHVLAQAVKRLYKDAKISVGPVTDDGFFYDIEFADPISSHDLEKIEKEMRSIVEADFEITREVWSRDKALSYFTDEPYKLELIALIPDGEEISIYKQGDFVDLCRGPHVLRTSSLKYFKLTGVSGAYWRGDVSKAMLTRLSGTAFADDASLQQHLTSVAAAEKRDHRKIGRELGLFHTQDIAVGQIFWHPRGYSMYLAIEDYIRSLLRKRGYQEVRTPLMVDSVLWQQSGHLEKFADNMISCEMDERHIVIKPMNCPCHVQIFKQDIRSYRDLPIRFAEFGMCHRNESSGSMRGLMRVRGFTQDDAHIFCTPDQITQEIVAFCQLVFEVYARFGFADNVRIKFSDRPETRAGDDALWDKAESGLMDALRLLNRNFEMNPGEGAFYGPKLEFVLRDALGRDWQCGTVQLDFVLPERLDIHYIGSDGGKHRPVMIHRAILGTFERFIGILIEHYEGKFPFWMAPMQVRIANISAESESYAREIESLYAESGFRVESDYSNNKIGQKIRSAIGMKVPMICIVGAVERDSRKVALRQLGVTNNETMGIDASIEFMKSLC